jgi:hypothetical protein
MLKPIKYLDKKGINEILEKAAALSFITLVKDTPRTKAEVLCEGFVLKLKEILPIHAGIVYIELLPFFKRSVKKRMKFSNRFFFSFTHLRNAVKQKIASYLSESPFGINKSDLLNLFPNGFMDITLLELIIKEMELDNQVIIGNRIELRRMTILEYAQNIPNDKERRILLSRLHGMTLDEIGKQHKVTRERIRQIVVKCLRNKPAVFEDKYIPLFNKYNFSLKDFISIFNEENFVYNYLTITSTQHGELPLNKLLNDETVNDEIKKCVERVI